MMGYGVGGGLVVRSMRDVTLSRHEAQDARVETAPRARPFDAGNRRPAQCPPLQPAPGARGTKATHHFMPRGLQLINGHLHGPDAGRGRVEEPVEHVVPELQLAIGQVDVGSPGNGGHLQAWV